MSYLAVSSQRVQRSERRLNICKSILFIFCKSVVISSIELLVFFRCRVKRRRPPLGLIHSPVLKIGVNHPTCYVYSPQKRGEGCERLTIFTQSRVPLGPGKFHLVVLVRQNLLRHIYTDNVMDSFLFVLLTAPPWVCLLAKRC